MSSSGGTRVLVVEDEPAFGEALRVGLGREGFVVELVDDGADAIAAFERFVPEVILLDVMLPTVSGIDICREIRTTSSVPIIMVSAKGEEIDTVVGLEVGADDYVTKPYRLRELVARIRAVLRRRGTPEMKLEASAASRVTVGDVHIDIDRHEVVVRDQPCDLPLKEFEILALLMRNAGRVLPRDVLIDRVWGSDYVGDTKTLDVHIKRVRSKIETDPGNPIRIVTIRGLGYKYQR